MDCSDKHSCISAHCLDPCTIGSRCGVGALCHSSYHRAICSCPDGWAGNPERLCYRPECTTDTDCPYNKACESGNCLDPCEHAGCGRGAECITEAHRPHCQCPLGSQGDPYRACVTGVCQYNEDCAGHEACDRLNRVCRPVCEEDTCASGAVCIGKDHQPTCVCPHGTTGNPYIECISARIPIPAECAADHECPSQQACLNAVCQDPCLAVSSVCPANQQCHVLDTLPLRTVTCHCPQDAVADASGHCTPVVPGEPQCATDSDCGYTEKCVRGKCVEACRTDFCGINAICQSDDHRAVCRCPPGYTGNPRVDCVILPTRPPLPPECVMDEDCPADRACHVGKCINPCSASNPLPCAATAFCHVEDHVPVCRCPNGYEGNPQQVCLPVSGPPIGCTANSECSLQESCVNQLCVSPCHCGPNSECRVSNHFPTCYCKPGFSGNPLIGCIKVQCQSDDDCSTDKQCYNGECVNPCILGAACAVNAECYGIDHRAACRCPVGYVGDPLLHCERTECRVDGDCPSTRACVQRHCVDPCAVASICASNAVCVVRNHAAACRCPEDLPLGDPTSFCERRPPPQEQEPECKFDVDCPSRQACLKSHCVDPCTELKPCAATARCSVLDTVPVRTMVCTCPEGWVPGSDGECRPVVVPVPPGCTSDDNCPSNETCINRICRNPCDCGTNANCFVQNHRPICSCQEGYDGNPNIGCYAVGCRTNSECDSGKACVNSMCVDPCTVSNPCGQHAECYTFANRAECRCISGFMGDPHEGCRAIGCRVDSDCPYDRACLSGRCADPCAHGYPAPCGQGALCRPTLHRAVCRCPPALPAGNPYVACQPKIRAECSGDPDCPPRLACLDGHCRNPCFELQPCSKPASCQVFGSVPVRTMFCTCPPGYISSGSGVCRPTPSVTAIGECSSDRDCPDDKTCIQGICKNPCSCGANSDCHVKDHRPTCTCKPGFDGNADVECVRVICHTDGDCSPQHQCVQRICVPACASDGSSCGKDALCYGAQHRAICECPPGLLGNPHKACVAVGCRANSDCPAEQSCISGTCTNPCTSSPCAAPAECKVYKHEAQCICPPGYIGDGYTTGTLCTKQNVTCEADSDCPSKMACINDSCVNPCSVTEPCGDNANCQVLDTVPVRTMICECPPGYQGNAAEKCEKARMCPVGKGQVLDEMGDCVCPPGYGLDDSDTCIRCIVQQGYKIDENGQCVCALEKGMIIDERGRCVCPVQAGYHLDGNGYCVKGTSPKCNDDDDCANEKYCNQETKTCENPCQTKLCGVNADCSASNHQAVCVCQPGWFGNPDFACNETRARTPFPKPEIIVNCKSDGVEVEFSLPDQTFNGILYVKGHSKDDRCSRLITPDTAPQSLIFKVNFGTCGLIHFNREASFLLVLQKHPKLVTSTAQAYHIVCKYETGEQNVTVGFNVSMLTTAGTIANTGPPPVCTMKIITNAGQEIRSAEIGENLQLHVEVTPSNIYGGFARSCIAKTVENNVENEYMVTDENGCATDPTIFGEWKYNAETKSLVASFNAFKFPSSDNIKFQCNIRVCFGKCQPVNCRDTNAFGRRKREIEPPENDTSVAIAESMYEGQLREEITIQSNAILTFERREERYTASTDAPETQKPEDICVSMVGFIIALVITALLALVAVAVAVSCWLIAYRRRPKLAGPLPHPPEFPNPLFTTPEPVAEPSPDYLT